MVRYVLQLLQRARADLRPVPWVLLENVEALLDRAKGSDPPIRAIVDCLEQLGYRSWAHRVVCSAGMYTVLGHECAVGHIVQTHWPGHGREPFGRSSVLFCITNMPSCHVRAVAYF